MNSRTSNFFIREDYVVNPVLTYNRKGVEEYWTGERLRLNSQYQFHVYEYAFRIFKENGFESIIDIGAGPAMKMKHFFDGQAKQVAIVDQPTTEAIVNQVFPGAKFYGADFEDESFATGNQYDMVICSDVIEHLGNPDALLTIIRKHLKPNGVAVLSTPDRDFRRGKGNLQSPNKQHVREWNAEELRKYLKHSGFEILEQVHLPLKKLPSLLFRISRLPFLHLKVRLDSWYPNQTLVLRQVQPPTST